MLGQIYPSDAEGAEKSLIKLVPLENQWMPEASAVDATYTKHRRYSIDPKDMLRVQRQARDEGLSIIGVYHSHPDHVAEPSECDRAQAWPDYAYTIMSVCKGKTLDVRTWALDSEHQFQPEAMQIAPSSATDRMPISA